MIVNGKYRIEALSQVVWVKLMDPKVLARITPGVSELIPLGEDKYQAISKVKIGPVNGSFTGVLEINNKIENTSANLVVDQKSKIGNVTAVIEMQLINIDNATQINYTGEAKLSGKIAMMGQRVIGGVINSLAKQFFKALNEEINS